MVKLTVDPHPSLDLVVFATVFPEPVGSAPSPAWLTALLEAEAPAPLTRDEETRLAVRDVLRHGGYKPTGRGKPASEYLVRAAGEGGLQTINPAVDACNVVSLHSGLPISLVDLDRAVEPLRVGLAGSDARYVFNLSGQEIRLGGLPCLHDAAGPCACAVKDSQRTKIQEGTCRTLTLIWGVQDRGDLAQRAATWYRELLGRLGATTEAVSTDG